MRSSPSGGPRALLRLPLLLLALPVVVVALPILGVAGLASRWRRHSLRRTFEARWASTGCLGVLVYSNSPNWQVRIEERWLPRLGGRLVSVNWSDRARWERTHPLEARIVRHFLGDRDFNPAAVVFPPGQAERVFRFRPAFLDLKHGKPAALEALEAELFAPLDSLSSTGE